MTQEVEHLPSKHEVPRSNPSTHPPEKKYIISFKSVFLQARVFFSVCVVLGLELRAFTLSHSTSPLFVMAFFKIGSLELFAWAGFEQRSS
jgi:hypothetical protein